MSLKHNLTTLLAAAALTFPACSDDYLESCVTDQDCPGNKICENQRCFDPTPNSISQGEVHLLYGQTDSAGKVFFTDHQSQEQVVISVVDSEGNSLPSTNVLFFDGDGFEAFLANHQDYTSLLQIFAHNSEHRLTLTPTPWEFHQYRGDKNEDSFTAAKKFSEYAQNQWAYVGCTTAETAELQREVITEVINFAGKIPGISEIVLVINKLYSLRQNFTTALIEAGVSGGECAAYQRYIFQSQQRVPNVGALVYTECQQEINAEIAGNHIDDNCNGSIDEKDSFGCTSHASKICHNQNLYWQNSCGALEEVVEYCTNGCQDNSCIGTVQDSCFLPSCIQHGNYSCASPCIKVESANQCILPCSSNSDCQGNAGFIMECYPLSDFNSQSGKGCFLKPCSEGCSSDESCIDFTDYGYQLLSSGAEPLAVIKSLDTCYDKKCLK